MSSPYCSDYLESNSNWSDTDYEVADEGKDETFMHDYGSQLVLNLSNKTSLDKP